ncbi:MAG TPA: DUF2332 domain-containing protein [Streptosporangiaceae bacterium]|nr:DUF2332 domain-containing protein [Streptosporangiaceae bacterium]
MHGHDLGLGAAENYLAFAQETRGRSPAYESLAVSVAADGVVRGFLGSLPPGKRQPNLLFAAARYLLGGVPDLGGLRDLASRGRDELAAVMLARRTQTNEPARCATLLPALAQLPRPLALIEAGASAGLTLLFDRYSYDYAGHKITGADPAAPVLRCEPRGPVPLPDRIPEITWRAGLDLSPLNVADDDDVRWLSCLVWPGEGDREQRLAAAVATARRDPPDVRRGDILTGLPGLAAQAPPDATLVIYHTAVLAYLTPADRERFAAQVRALPAVWLSNEGPGIVPGQPIPPYRGTPFVLARDGRTILALTDSHGTWLDWHPSPQPGQGQARGSLPGTTPIAPLCARWPLPVSDPQARPIGGYGTVSERFPWTPQRYAGCPLWW